MRSISIVFLFFALSSWAQSGLSPSDSRPPQRIESLRFNKGIVQSLYLAPGLGSLILFPCGLTEVFVGRSEDLKAQISPNDKKSLLLNLKLRTSLPTNIIARCENGGVFVFDVIPSRLKHQDVVEIKSSYGGPGFKESDLKEVTAVGNRRVIVMKPKVEK